MKTDDDRDDGRDKDVIGPSTERIPGQKRSTSRFTGEVTSPILAAKKHKKSKDSGSYFASFAFLCGSEYDRIMWSESKDRLRWDDAVGGYVLEDKASEPHAP